MLKGAWPFWLSLAAVVVLLDFVTKYLVLHQLPYGTAVPISSFFRFVHLGNPGAAFGFLSDAGGWQRYALTVLAFAVSLWLTVMLVRGRPAALESLGFSLILGGAIGNAIDRLLHGHVIDFLDFHWASWHFPAFNGADIAISIGVVSLIVWALTDALRGSSICVTASCSSSQASKKFVKQRASYSELDGK